MPTSMMQVSQPVTHTFDNTFKKYQPPDPPVKVGDRVNPLGIEVIDSIVWQDWEPGREYTKNLTLKNVQVKTQKIKYNVPNSRLVTTLYPKPIVLSAGTSFSLPITFRPLEKDVYEDKMSSILSVPNSRFFTTLYPTPIVLSAGTSFSLPITFRPLEKDVYEDKIEFHTKEGVFEVPIKAVLPKYDIKVPETINFNMCASKDFVEATFDVTNTGDLETDVEWEVSDPFIIEPMMTRFTAGQTTTFRAIFKPRAATVFEATALCKYGPESSLSKNTTLHGIGKFPHILVSIPGKPSTTLGKDNLEAVIQFGPTPVGTSVQKMVELHNLSPVRVPFKVDHPSALSRIDTVFKCSILQGIVPPMASVKVPITFSPNTVGVTSIDYFNVVAIGNISKSVVKCVGSSRGPEVQLGAKVVNFMQIDIGDTATRTIDIVNNSDIDAVYQFEIDCNESIFKFERTSGEIKANTQQTIILRFVPQHPINYYRRVTCMIHNQGPLFLDLVGTCHSELVKPAVLLAKHLDNYHVERGFSVYPPEQLND